MKDLELLKKEVERITGISNIASKNKSKELIHARALFYLVAMEGGKETLSVIGNVVGKNHCAVIHAMKMRDVYMKDKQFKFYYSRLNPEDFERDLTEYEETINELQQRILVLNDQLKNKFSTGLRRSHSPLLEIINNIPDYHVETVRVRLQPIVKMLEKPSRHNYLPA